MEVYLVPVGNSRYELYCEIADETPTDEPAATRGVVRKLIHVFRGMIAAAEREHRHTALGDGVETTSEGARPAARRNWMRRVRDRVLRWVAEAIAEQRLLWHLRRQDRATVVYPTDLEEADALSIVRDALQRDADRHRFWLVIDGVGLVLSAFFVIIPGPNLVAYYFAFRVVGHYLSRRGARQGLSRISWSGRTSELLAELRRALELPPAERRQRLRNLASRMKLKHLAAFVERTTVRSVS